MLKLRNGKERRECPREDYQDVYGRAHDLVLKKKRVCGLEHMFILNHRVACNPDLFAQAVESPAAIFLSIYIEAAAFPCGG